MICGILAVCSHLCRRWNGWGYKVSTVTVRLGHRVASGCMSFSKDSLACVHKFTPTCPRRSDSIDYEDEAEGGDEEEAAVVNLNHVLDTLFADMGRTAVAGVEAAHFSSQELRLQKPRVVDGTRSLLLLCPPSLNSRAVSLLLLLLAISALVEGGHPFAVLVCARHSTPMWSMRPSVSSCLSCAAVPAMVFLQAVLVRMITLYSNTTRSLIHAQHCPPACALQRSVAEGAPGILLSPTLLVTEANRPRGPVADAVLLRLLDAKAGITGERRKDPLQRRLRCAALQCSDVWPSTRRSRDSS